MQPDMTGGPVFTLPARLKSRRVERVANERDGGVAGVGEAEAPNFQLDVSRSDRHGRSVRARAGGKCGGQAYHKGDDPRDASYRRQMAAK